MSWGLGSALPTYGQGLTSPQWLPPSPLTFCPSACLPAISIPVVHLHFDGPVRQRARGGMGLTQHPHGLKMELLSCSWARRGCGDIHQKDGTFLML